jgi:hypothetical protein
VGVNRSLITRATIGDKNMNVIKNDVELLKMLEEQLGQALEEAATEILDLFLEKYIDKYAYIKNPQMYIRTMEFRDSWEFSDLFKTAHGVAKELFYNDANMKTFNPKLFQHGSKYSSPNDVRKTLPSILEGKQSNLWISVNRNVKFFEKFLDDMISKGKLDKILNKYLKKRGFRRV